MSDKEASELQGELRIPSDLESERAVLGTILGSLAFMEEAAELLRPEDFFFYAHRTIFEAMLEIRDRGEAVDIITTNAELSSRNQIDAVGGMAYLADCANGRVRPKNLRSYAKSIIRRAQERDLITAGNQIIAEASEGAEDTADLIFRARDLVEKIGSRREGADFTSVKDLISSQMEIFEEIQANPGRLLGVPSGYGNIDAVTRGFKPGDMVIVAARTSVGKSALALNMALNAARQGYAVGFLSLEMNKDALALRLAASEAMIDSQRAVEGNLQKEDWQSLTAALGRVSSLKLEINDSANSTISDIKARARRLKVEKGLDILFVDYLQKIVFEKKTYSREQEISHISSSVKTLAQELNIPVIIMSQVNRSTETRADHTPTLSDLRESGSLEQDSDMVFFIYRPDMYRDSRAPGNEGIAEVILAKHRNGPTKNFYFQFLKQYSRFEPATQIDIDGYRASMQKGKKGNGNGVEF